MERKTKETEISVEVLLDGIGKHDVDTGIGFLDHMISQMSKHGRIDVTMRWALLALCSAVSTPNEIPRRTCACTCTHAHIPHNSREEEEWKRQEDVDVAGRHAETLLALMHASWLFPGPGARVICTFATTTLLRTAPLRWARPLTRPLGTARTSSDSGQPTALSTKPSPALWLTSRRGPAHTWS